MIAGRYSGLNASDGNISLMSAKYNYDPETDEGYYEYFIAAVNTAGEDVFCGDTIGVSTKRRGLLFGLYAAIAAMVLIGIYSAVKVVHMVKAMELAKSNTQVLILVTAIVVTVGVSLVIFNTCNDRFVSESAANLSNIAYLIDATIDKETVEALDSPDMYFDESYEALNEDIMSVLKSGVNGSSNIYTCSKRTTWISMVKSSALYSAMRELR